MTSLPIPDLTPQSITYEEFLKLMPEKFEWVGGYLFDSLHNHRERRRLLSVLLTNQGLIRTVQLAPLEHWLGALWYAYGEKREGASPGHPIVCEESLGQFDEGAWFEWMDGEMVKLPPVSHRHQDIVGFLTSVLRVYVEIEGIGRIIGAPFSLKLEREQRPDLLFVATEHLDRLYSGGLQGPADLVVEIVSTDSLERDRGAKFVEYEAGEVGEYWLIDPIRRWAEFYRLDDGGRYETIFAAREGVYRSEALPDFWLRVEWLWLKPLPRPLRVLVEIAGVDTDVVERFLQALGGE